MNLILERCQKTNVDGNLLKLNLSSLVDVELRAYKSIKITNNLWTTHYKKAFNIKMGGWVIVMTQID